MCLPTCQYLLTIKPANHKLKGWTSWNNRESVDSGLDKATGLNYWTGLLDYTEVSSDLRNCKVR